MTQSGGAGKCERAIPGGNQKAALRMSVGSGKRVVVGAQSLCDLTQRVGALGLGLALEEQNEALTANRTTEIRGIRSAFAQNLHGVDGPFVVPVFQLQRRNSKARAKGLTMTRTGTFVNPKGYGEVPLLG